MTYAQQLLEEGRAEGEAKGRAEGEAKGRAEGEQRGKVKAVEGMLRVGAGLGRHRGRHGSERIPVSGTQGATGCRFVASSKERLMNANHRIP